MSVHMFGEKRAGLQKKYSFQCKLHEYVIELKR